MILGDSIAAQNGIREALEEKLNLSSLLGPGYKFELWNASVPSYDVRRYAIYLKQKGVNYKPDMVAIFFFLNDFDPYTFVYYKDKKGIVRFDFSFRELPKIYFPNSFLIQHSYLYRFVILRLENYLVKRKRIGNISPEEETGRFYLNIIKDICKDNNITLFCVIFSNLSPLSEYDDNQMLQYRSMRKVLKDLNVHYIDLRNYLPEERMSSLRERREDDVHPSREAERIIAEIIYNHMQPIFFQSRS